MSDVLVWWLVVEVVGLAALPIAFRLFGSLPDRGYAFAKPLGIFLTSYSLWILAMLGIVRNTGGTLVLIVAALVAASWWLAMRRPTPVAEAKTRRVVARPDKTRPAPKRQVIAEQGERPEILTWLRANVRLVAAEEALFLGGLVLWAIFKAYNPEITATEKPMEIAFLNGILRSEQFPPLDPWLSGFAISYYYLGYVMMACLTRLSGITPSVAFNLMLVLSFALTLTGAFSVVYNLLSSRQPAARPALPIAGGLLGSFFVALMGNLEGFLEFFYIRGLGSPAFWRFISIDGLDQPYVAPSWYPTTNWWWWKASRVIGTKGPIGDYTINEFPFFSFMLGDNHPHVLALPYVLMALALALTMLLAPQRNFLRGLREGRWLDLAGAWFLPALMLGGLFFLNSWDFPTYTMIAVLAYGLRVFRDRQTLDRDALAEMGLFALPVGIIGIVLYLPFYVSFQSQAGGFNLVRVRTQLHHFLIIFGPFLFITSGLVAVKLREWRALSERDRQPARPWIIPLLVIGIGAGAILVAMHIWQAVTTLLLTSLLSGVIVSLLLLLVILLTLFALVANVRGDIPDLFVLVLMMVGCLVILGPEWGHIEDGFGGSLARMNTVFKFHYQAWILLALSAAYAALRVASSQAGKVSLALSPLRLGYVACMFLLVLACCFYPVMAFYTKANMFQGMPTLDGLAYMERYHPDEYSAIQWLNQNVKGTPVIVEAIGGSFTEYARVSAHTGLPAVQGWGGHEVQWRGNARGWEEREGDVDRIYSTTDVNTAKTLLKKYGVTYVYVGRLERETRGSDGQPKYNATALGKFATFMDTVYQQGTTSIYRVRE